MNMDIVLINDLDIIVIDAIAMLRLLVQAVSWRVQRRNVLRR